jgi:hypothetical protein
MDKYYLEIWMTAKPFTGMMRLGGANLHQRNIFLSVTKAFVEGFGLEWERKLYILEYDQKKQSTIKFHGEKKWLLKQKKYIEEEMFKAVMQEEFRHIREKLRRAMPFKKRLSDAEMQNNSKYDKFVASLALFNITFIMDIKKNEAEFQPTD